MEDCGELGFPCGQICHTALRLNHKVRFAKFFVDSGEAIRVRRSPALRGTKSDRYPSRRGRAATGAAITDSEEKHYYRFRRETVSEYGSRFKKDHLASLSSV